MDVPVNPANHPLILFCVTAVVSSLLTGVFTWYARSRDMLDIPDERHSHTVPTPRGGGAGIVAALIITTLILPVDSMAMTFWWFCLMPGFVSLSLVGWLDDQVSLSAISRFFVQVLVSIYLLWCLNHHDPSFRLLPFLVAGIFLLWITNLYNFMDGSNGMAGSQGVFAGLILTWLFFRTGDPEAAVISSLIAAACLGFLPWNLGNARVFMGDVASGALGFSFASLLIYGVTSGSLTVVVAWMVMLVFTCDSTLTLLVRVLRGEQWYNPHKQHLYQRLITRGWSHGRVLLLYQAINILLVMPAIAVAVNRPALAIVVGCTTTLICLLAWSLAMQKLGVFARAE